MLRKGNWVLPKTVEFLLTQFLIQDTDLWWQILAPNPFIAIHKVVKLMGIKLKVLYSVVFTC